MADAGEPTRHTSAVPRAASTSNPDCPTAMRDSFKEAKHSLVTTQPKPMKQPQASHPPEPIIHPTTVHEWALNPYCKWEDRVWWLFRRQYPWALLEDGRLPSTSDGPLLHLNLVRLWALRHFLQDTKPSDNIDNPICYSEEFLARYEPEHPRNNVLQALVNDEPWLPEYKQMRAAATTLQPLSCVVDSYPHPLTAAKRRLMLRQLEVVRGIVLGEAALLPPPKPLSWRKKLKNFLLRRPNPKQAAAYQLPKELVPRTAPSSGCVWDVSYL